MKQPLKLMIYAINGRGMGHLNRTLVLADAVRKADPNADIKFVVRSPLFGMVKDSGFEVVKIPDNHHALGRFALRSAAQARLSAVFESILEWGKPDWFLIDFVVEPKLFATVKERGTKLGLILRAQRPEEMVDLAKKKCIEQVDHFLLPHDPSEFPLTELPRAWRARSSHLGPLARTLDPATVSRTRLRYAEENERLVVVSIGGGGFKESYNTLELAERAAAALAQDEAGRRVRWVLVYGPYYPGSIPESDAGVKRLRYEAALLELFAASDVVVCNAGYNTVSEVQVCGTPAVIIPLATTGRDDQHLRAQRAAEEGIALLCEENVEQLREQVAALLRGERVSRRAPEVSGRAQEIGERVVSVLRR